MPERRYQEPTDAAERDTTVRPGPWFSIGRSTNSPYATVSEAAGREIGTVLTCVRRLYRANG